MAEKFSVYSGFTYPFNSSVISVAMLLRSDASIPGMLEKASSLNLPTNIIVSHILDRKHRSVCLGHPGVSADVSVDAAFENSTWGCDRAFLTLEENSV